MEVMMNQRAFLFSLLLIIVFGFGALVVYDAKTNNRLETNRESTSNWNWNDDWDAKDPIINETEEGGVENPPETPEHPIVAKSYAEALVLSGKHGMPILVVFYADWCNWCKELDKTLAEESVKEAMKKYIYVRVDSDSNRDIAKKHEVKFLPYYTITNSDEEILKGDGGYKKAGEFVKWLNNPQLYKQPKKEGQSPDEPKDDEPDQEPDRFREREPDPERRWIPRWRR